MKVSRRWFVSAAAMTALIRPAISLPAIPPSSDINFPEDLALARAGTMSVRDSIKLAFRYQKWRQTHDGMLYISQHGDPYKGCKENEIEAAKWFEENSPLNPNWKDPICVAHGTGEWFHDERIAAVIRGEFPVPRLAN